MRWYEYKMEVDDLHASDDLKAKLLAMQATKTESSDSPAEAVLAVPVSQKPIKKKKAVRFPVQAIAGVAACVAVGFVCANILNQNDTSLLRTSSATDSAENSIAQYSLEAAGVSTYSTETSRAAVGGSNSVMLSAETAQTTSRAKIIYTATLSLEAKDYDAAQQAISDALSAAGGYLESSSESTANASSRELSLTLRIPEENYESFLEAAANAGNLVSKRQQADDVTSQYMDIETRLENLKAQRTRLEELQTSAANLSDLLEIESSLSDVQYQIESWQSQLDWYSQQVECCTVYIDLAEVKDFTSTDESFGGRLLAALTGGWSTFVNGIQQLVVSLVSVWPAVILGAAAGVALFFHRRKHKNR